MGADGGLIETRGMGRVLPGPVPVTLVTEVDLVVGRGEFVAVSGPSGSGKSSLLYLLGLLDRPTQGTVLLMDRDTAEFSAGQRAEARLRHIGFVFQFHYLLPEFTALGNVLIPMQKLGARDPADARAAAMRILRSLDMEAYAQRRPDQLSGGQRQRIAIARALANDPALVLADEPTGNLDSKNASQVFEEFARLADEQGKTVVVVTHEPHLARRASRRIHLVDGRIVEDVTV